ncbi:MAG: alpha/beta hydrolase [Dermatophilaceae bacterium]
MTQQQPGAGVDQVVFFGSPGIGTEHVSALGVPDRSVWYAEAVKDPVGDLSWFGPDLSTTPGVRHLDTADATTPDGQHLAGVEGRSDYLDQNTTSQYNLATIVAGHPEAAIQGANLDLGDTHPDRPWRSTSDDIIRARGSEIPGYLTGPPALNPPASPTEYLEGHPGLPPRARRGQTSSGR